MTEKIYYERGYNKGFADAQEVLSKKFEKLLEKETQKAYKEGANQKNNKPCVCGFWGDTETNKQK